MSTVEQIPAVAGRPRTVRGTCLGCQRPYGRRRAPRDRHDVRPDVDPALLTCSELFVCDQCWHAAGGAAAVQVSWREVDQQPAAAPDADGHADGIAEAPGDGRPPERELVLQAGLEFPPALQRLLAEADAYDVLHPIDRLLVSSGVRWTVLRHIPVPARMRLAARVVERTAAAHTAAAPSALVWLDAVDERIAEQTGTEFRYRCKSRRWRAIAAALSSCTDHDSRPLTWVTQEELAAVAGCTPRTVSRCVRWLREQNLLLEVVPGCKLPQQHVPDGETEAERTARLARLAQAVAAEEAAMARARRELDAIRATPAFPAAQLALTTHTAGATATADAPSPADPGHDQSDPTAALIHLAPVYELRIPRPPDELLVEPLSPTPPAVRAPAPLTSDNAALDAPGSENVVPPRVLNEDPKSSCVQPVDKRRAPRGSHRENPSKIVCSAGDSAIVSTAEPAGQAVKAQQSRSVEVARWLLHKKLDVALCSEVSVRWLAALIRSSQLLDRYDWTPDDLLDLLHGYPEHVHLPRYIREPRAWIRARFARAIPTLSPTKQRFAQNVERTSTYLRERAAEEQRQQQAAERAARRAAIQACPLCDETGYLQIGEPGPGEKPMLARCTHVVEDGGY